VFLSARATAAPLMLILVLGLSCREDGAAGPVDRGSVAAWMEFHRVPGVSVAVFSNFEPAYLEVHGVRNTTTRDPVTVGTLFQAASLSKGVSSVGVLTLVEDGTVSLDTDVIGYLTSWQVPPNGLQATQKVTLRRLLSHTAGTTVRGFRGYRYTEPLPTLIEILNGEPPANSAPVVVDLVPGSRFRYSGGGYVIAEQVVKDLTAMPFPEFMWERVLSPIAMASSTYQQPLPDSLRGLAASGYYADGTAVPGGHHIYPEIAAARLWTTAADLARFLTELQQSLQGESNRVLS
jgi:CubicO group peptidase (beta-lactamase class C family)